MDKCIICDKSFRIIAAFTKNEVVYTEYLCHDYLLYGPVILSYRGYLYAHTYTYLYMYI